MVSKIFLPLCFFLLCFYISLAQISLAPYQTIATGSFARVVTIGDLNNDGLNDVVIGTSRYFDPPNDCKLFIFYQNSTGGLNLPVKYSYPISSPTILGIAVGDVNNDQLNDLVFCFNDSIGIYFQNAAHTFNPLVTYFSGAFAEALKLGDLNNDGLTDIAVVHQNEIFIRIFYQTSTGFTTASYAKPYSYRSDLKIGDLNNDQLTDVAFVSYDYPAALYVFTQNSQGLLNPVQTYPILAPLTFGFRCMAIGDLNKDGRNDVAVGMGGNQPDSRILLYFQDSLTGLLQTPDTILSLDYPVPMEISDLKCNGTNEIIVMAATTFLNIFEPDSISYQYGNYSSIPAPNCSDYKTQGMAIGDINNDGSKDVVLATYSFGLVYFLNQYSQVISFTPYDTLLKSDTTNHFINDFYSSFITRSIINIDITCLVIKVDSFQIKQSFSLDSIRIDSVYINAKTICTFLTDTIIHAHTIFKNVLVSTDTLLLKSRLDTILTPMVIINTITYANNFYKDTITQNLFFDTKKIIENNSGCSIIQKDIYYVTKTLRIDSLKIDTTFIRSARTCGKLKTDSLVKNIILFRSSLISSDTSLFVTSFDSIVNSSAEEFKLCNLMKLYPLPSDNEITLEISDPCYNFYKAKDVNLELYDINAKLVFAKTISSLQFPFVISLSNYANGIYCLRASVDKDFCIKKVIKEN